MDLLMAASFVLVVALLFVGLWLDGREAQKGGPR
jgi:hypothetical protein